MQAGGVSLRMKQTLLLLLLGLGLSACTSGPTPASHATQAPGPTPKATSSPPISPPSTASPTIRGCLLTPGEFISDEYENDGLPRSIPYRVYLPACFRETTGQTLPVLILLHGLQATDQQWVDLGIGAVADRLITSGEAPPFLVVLPWERRGLEFETAVADFLLPHIQATYHGSTDRSRVAIGGLSRGAGWALRIGLKRPTLFGSIGLHSPAVLSPDLYYLPEWIDSTSEDVRPRMWIDIGDQDSLRTSVFELTNLLDDQGYEYEWSDGPGDHLADYWSSHLEAYLAWYSRFW
jgi:enterochelin esterase-like enzyme